MPAAGKTVKSMVDKIKLMDAGVKDNASILWANQPLIIKTKHAMDSSQNLLESLAEKLKHH
jgi:hypothetical protein